MTVAKEETRKMVVMLFLFFSGLLCLTLNAVMPQLHIFDFDWYVTAFSVLGLLVLLKMPQLFSRRFK